MWLTPVTLKACLQVNGVKREVKRILRLVKEHKYNILTVNSSREGGWHPSCCEWSKCFSRQSSPSSSPSINRHANVCRLSPGWDSIPYITVMLSVSDQWNISWLSHATSRQNDWSFRADNRKKGPAWQSDRLAHQVCSEGDSARSLLLREGALERAER